MNDHDDNWLEPDLRVAGRAVAGLRRTSAPAGLIERTLERAALIKPLRKKLLFFRPITHPWARVAAVVVLMTMVAAAPLTDLDTVDSLGRRIEYNVVGSTNVDRFEQFMDNVLAKINSDGYSQNELDAVTGMYNTSSSSSSTTHTKTMKPRTHSKV